MKHIVKLRKNISASSRASNRALIEGSATDVETGRILGTGEVFAF